MAMLLALPEEIIDIIISHVNEYPNLVRLSETCKYLRIRIGLQVGHVNKCFDDIERLSTRKYKGYSTADQSAFFLDGTQLRYGTLGRPICEIVRNVDRCDCSSLQDGSWLICYGCRTIKQKSCFRQRDQTPNLPVSTLWGVARIKGNPYISRRCLDCVIRKRKSIEPRILQYLLGNLGDRSHVPQVSPS